MKSVCIGRRRRSVYFVLTRSEMPTFLTVEKSLVFCCIFLSFTSSWANPIAPDCPSACKCLGNFVDCSEKGLIDVPKDIPKWVEYLDLKMNAIRVLDTNVFAHLENLTKLDLSKNVIRTVRDGMLGNSSQLQELILEDNELTEMPFLGTGGKSLRRLYLARNQIHSLNATALSSLTELTFLDLSSNGVVDIPFDAFPLASERLTVLKERIKPFDALTTKRPGRGGKTGLGITTTLIDGPGMDRDDLLGDFNVAEARRYFRDGGVGAHVSQETFNDDYGLSFQADRPVMTANGMTLLRGLSVADGIQVHYVPVYPSFFTNQSILIITKNFESPSRLFIVGSRRRRCRCGAESTLLDVSPSTRETLRGVVTRRNKQDQRGLNGYLGASNAGLLSYGSSCTLIIPVTSTLPLASSSGPGFGFLLVTPSREKRSRQEHGFGGKQHGGVRCEESVECSCCRGVMNRLGGLGGQREQFNRNLLLHFGPGRVDEPESKKEETTPWYGILCDVREKGEAERRSIREDREMDISPTFVRAHGVGFVPGPRRKHCWGPAPSRAPCVTLCETREKEPGDSARLNLDSGKKETPSSVTENFAALALIWSWPGHACLFILFSSSDFQAAFSAMALLLLLPERNQGEEEEDGRKYIMKDGRGGENENEGLCVKGVARRRRARQSGRQPVVPPCVDLRGGAKKMVLGSPKVLLVSPGASTRLSVTPSCFYPSGEDTS
ncbi:unnamed protein product [Notodromas monacha]|uniref:LRRNT domain-containing protein n=1 Tax=Notodromas monacha TaxID=399045 RepID=A0A7R9BJY2_9CRUS|nr:unnamed protein product [Notodromas monacha]CAG0915530.1 unnamed protein product [Notodromas monacha]